MADNIWYEIISYGNKEDQAFIAEVPELPGCAADGATYQDALANVEVVIREWIETNELAKSLALQRAGHFCACCWLRNYFRSTSFVTSGRQL